MTLQAQEITCRKVARFCKVQQHSKPYAAAPYASPRRIHTHAALPQHGHNTISTGARTHGIQFPPATQLRLIFGTLTRSALECLAEHKQLRLIVDGQHTGTGNATEDVGTSTLEQRPDTFLGDDLASGIQGGLVFDSLLNVIVSQNVRLSEENTQWVNLLHQKSSSYAYGRCREGRKRYQHRW